MQIKKMNIQAIERLICINKELLKILEDGYTQNLNNTELREKYIMTIEKTKRAIYSENAECIEQRQELHKLKEEYHKEVT